MPFVINVQYVRPGDMPESVKSAFLQSEIDKEIYLKPFQGIRLPAGLQLNDVLLKLRKSMYGLKQAPPKLWGDDFKKAPRRRFAFQTATGRSMPVHP